MGENEIIESLFGWLGAVILLYFYISPVFPFSKLLKEQMNYKDCPRILLICSFLNCIFSADYGLLKNITSLYIANSVGGAITLIWITIYLIYMGKKYFISSFIINIVLLILVGSFSYIFYFIFNEYITGIIYMIFNSLMYAAPIEMIIYAIKNGKYELFPIFCSFGVFGCSFCWLIFGLFQKDRNLIIPNAFGLLFSIIQIIFYLIYYLHNNKNRLKQENILLKDKKINQ
jgi:solute carrier family 50 protein (sugar transporter)